MIKFQKEMKLKYVTWLKDILQAGIDNKLLKPEAIKFADGLFTMAEGVLLFSHFDNYNEEQIIQSYVHSLFKLMTIKGSFNDN